MVLESDDAAVTSLLDCEAANFLEQEQGILFKVLRERKLSTFSGKRLTGDQWIVASFCDMGRHALFVCSDQLAEHS